MSSVVCGCDTSSASASQASIIACWAAFSAFRRRCVAPTKVEPGVYRHAQQPIFGVFGLDFGFAVLPAVVQTFAERPAVPASGRCQESLPLAFLSQPVFGLGRDFGRGLVSGVVIVAAGVGGERHRHADR